MKRIISFCLIFITLCFGLVYKSSKKTQSIVIYTSTEDYNMKLLQTRLNERFPDYDIVIEYMSTSNIATKVIKEGTLTECDIVYQLEYGYLDKMIEANALASIEGIYDMSVFVEDTLNDVNKNYILPINRIGGGIIINNKVLNDKNLPKPTCYEDLTKPKYKGLISMPSPKSSSTGYMFYLSLINSWGEDKTIKYFDKFAKNVINFTSSGSGPVNALTNREAAIGFGMISQAVEKISNGNSELEILFFEEGAPFSLYGTAVVNGKEIRPEVMEVMDYIYSVNIEESCRTYYPEPILKNKTYDVLNFPKNIIYSNMSNNTISQKENLLNKWKY